MKRLLVAVICSVILFSGCGNITYTDEYGTKDLGFIDINNTLVYDKNTFIVYFGNFTYNGHRICTPYYSTNGKLYRYNVKTCMIEEIE